MRGSNWQDLTVMRAAKLRVFPQSTEIQRGRKLQVVVLPSRWKQYQSNDTELLWSLEITLALIEARICVWSEAHPSNLSKHYATQEQQQQQQQPPMHPSIGNAPVMTQL